LEEYFDTTEKTSESSPDTGKPREGGTRGGNPGRRIGPQEIKKKRGRIKPILELLTFLNFKTTFRKKVTKGRGKNKKRKRLHFVSPKGPRRRGASGTGGWASRNRQTSKKINGKKKIAEAVEVGGEIEREKSPVPQTPNGTKN